MSMDSTIYYVVICQNRVARELTYVLEQLADSVEDAQTLILDQSTFDDWHKLIDTATSEPDDDTVHYEMHDGWNYTIQPVAAPGELE